LIFFLLLITLIVKKGFKLIPNELKRILYKVKNSMSIKVILINILIKEKNFFEIIIDKTFFNKSDNGEIFKYSNIIDYCLNSIEIGIKICRHCNFMSMSFISNPNKCCTNYNYKINFLIVLFKNMFKLESSNEKVKEILSNLRRVIPLNDQFIKNIIFESSPYWIKFLIKSEKGCSISIVNYLDLRIKKNYVIKELRDLLKNNGFK